MVYCGCSLTDLATTGLVLLIQSSQYGGGFAALCRRSKQDACGPVGFSLLGFQLANFLDSSNSQTSETHKPAKLSKPAKLAKLLKLPRKLIEAISAEVFRRGIKIFFDPQELVVLRDSVGTRQRACLYLPGVCRDREISDKRIFRLT